MYTIERMAQLPVLLFITHPNYDELAEREIATREVRAILDAETEPVYYVMDFTGFTPDFSEVVQSANQAARGSNPTFHHPNIREIIFVTTNELLRTVARNMQNDVYGNVAIRVFETRDEALDYVEASY